MESKDPDDSSSSDVGYAASSSKSNDWKINLMAFSKTKTKLYTAINDSTRCGELMRAYFSHQETAFTQLPWKDKRPAHGINPLVKYFYIECEASNKKAMEVLCWEV